MYNKTKMHEEQVPELLAPAGGMEGMVAAVRTGADAVYLGGKYLNARRGAANFDEAGLVEAVSYCHTRNVKVYLTLNTIVFDDELDMLHSAVENACKAGVDAVLVQDMAAASLIRMCAPSLPLHASTQMSIHNREGAEKLAELGFARVVLARELSRSEIADVIKNTAIETEVFVHGALCMSVSGQCLLSSMIGGRSGNRGMCAQPCRLPFKSEDNEYALSLRDMTNIPHLQELIELGVSSLKIEGRLKRPEYVAAAVTACRQAIDGENPDMTVLEAVFSRSGFTDGYFTGKRDNSMFGIRRKEDVVSAAPALKPLAALYKDERQLVPVNLHFTMKQELPVCLEANDEDGNSASVTGLIPEQALTAPLTTDRIAALLGKTGGTPYFLKNLSCDMDDGLRLSASDMNNLRREVISQLHAMREVPQAHTFDIRKAEGYREALHIPERQEMRIRINGVSQISETLLREADKIILPVNLWEQAKTVLPKNRTLIEIPRILFMQEAMSIREALREAKAGGITGAVAGNLGGIRLADEIGFMVHGDYSLNVVNSTALLEYGRMGLRDVTMSFETSAARLKGLTGDLPRGIIAYGYLPLMALRNCPESSVLTDRLGKAFHIERANGSMGMLHNSVPLYLADKLGEFSHMDFITLYFTKETPEECLDILRRYKAGKAIDGQKTNGLYFRDVL